jgi:hypothetical protein
MKFKIFDSEKITNRRIRRLVEFSGKEAPFDRLPVVIETFDENQKLSSRRQFSIAHYRPVSLAHTSEYLLVYYDGQLVEVSDLTTREVLFRNITENCARQLQYRHDWTPFSHR